MKKLSFILVFILSLSVFAFLGACSKKDEQGSTIEVMYDFESTRRNLYQFKPHMDFGVISINNDADYVTQGKYSYMLKPMGIYGNTAKPVLIFPTYANDFDYNFMDFTKVKSVVIDVYNAEESVVEMDMGVSFDAGNYVRTESWFMGSPYETFYLLPGWNTVTYVVQHDLLSMRGDLSEVYGVYIAFNNAGTMLASECETLYIDNMRVEKLETPHVPRVSLNLAKDEENGIFEIASFEEDYQKYFVWVNRDRTRKMHPDFTIYNPLMGDEIGNVLRLDTRQMPVDHVVYPQTIICADAMRQAIANAMANAGDGEYEYYFCIDIYNGSDVQYRFTPNFLNDSTNSGYASRLWKNVMLEPNTWTTYEENLNNVMLKETTTDADGKTIYVDVCPFLDDPGGLIFSWAHYEDEDRRYLLLDNVRIERRAIEA